MKILIDTNIIIHLEDAAEVSKRFSDLLRKCQENSIKIFVHEASIEDIKRDKNAKRRAVTLSKLQKFMSLTKVASPTEAELAKLYGKLAKPNDVCDAKMLHAVKLEAVDVFVTEDDKLHRRAKASGLGDQVLTVADTVVWLQSMFEPDQVWLPTVQTLKAYSVDFKDKIFDGFSGDYDEFEKWTAKCISEHRDCWVVMDNEAIAGIVVRKDETHAEAGTSNPGTKILKICTFKVAEGYRGFKIGEQLLKQILWHVQRNGYDLTYLTAFPKQDALIRLIEEYGFEHTLTHPSGEFVFEKTVSHGTLLPAPSEAVLDAVKQNYPRFSDGPAVRKFFVPIEPNYHAKLFPEMAAHALNEPGVGARPGNTIKKVYICHAPSNQLRPGDLLFFYLMKSASPGSQSITSLGVVESVRTTHSVDQVRNWTAKRSVFSDVELGSWVGGPKPLKVIDFLLIGHFARPLSLDELMQEGVMNGWPQSITQLKPAAYSSLKPLLELGFDF